MGVLKKSLQSDLGSSLSRVLVDALLDLHAEVGHAEGQTVGTGTLAHDLGSQSDLGILNLLQSLGVGTADAAGNLGGEQRLVLALADPHGSLLPHQGHTHLLDAVLAVLVDADSEVEGGGTNGHLALAIADLVDGTGLGIGGGVVALDAQSGSLGHSGSGSAGELHPKSWTRKSTKGVQKSMGKELFSEELKLAVVQYVLEGHTRKEASEKFCVSCTPIEKWVNLYKLHGAKGLLSRNLVGRQKGFDGEFRLKVLQYKQEHHLSCTQTAMHFCLDVVTVCRWEKKFQKEGAQGLMKKQATKGSEKRQKKQEQSELQQENKRLSEENYRLKMENDYLKKLNALIQKREKPE